MSGDYQTSEYKRQRAKQNPKTNRKRQQGENDDNAGKSKHKYHYPLIIKRQYCIYETRTRCYNRDMSRTTTNHLKIKV